MAQAPPAYRLECGIVCYGQLSVSPIICESPPCPPRLELATVGQPFVGIIDGPVGRPPEDPPTYTFECGFGFCRVERQFAFTDVNWNTTTGNWNLTTNWDPQVLPDNSEDEFYRVLVQRFPNPVVSLNVSPVISELTLDSDARLIVDHLSGSNTIDFEPDPGLDGADNVFNGGRFEVTSLESGGPSPARDRTLTLLDANIDQSPTATLFSRGTVNQSTLRLVQCRVHRGVLHSEGTRGLIRLFGTTLIDVRTEGVVVADDNDGSAAAAVQGMIDNPAGQIIRIGPAVNTTPGAWRLSPNTASPVTLVGGGEVRLTSESGAQLGGAAGRIVVGPLQSVRGEGRIAGGIDNDGAIEANAAGRMLAVDSPQAALVNNASGALRAIGGGIVEIRSDVSNSGTIEASGAGSVLSVEHALTNGGVIRVAALAQGVVSAPIVQGAAGRIEVNGAGTELQVRTSINPGGGRAGDIIVRGGRISVNDEGAAGRDLYANCVDVPPGSISECDINRTNVGLNGLIITGGVVRLTGGTIADVAGDVSICPAVSPPGSVAELHVLGSTLAAQTLTICPGGLLEVASGVTVRDALSLGGTDESRWSFSPSSTLTMSGGVGQSDSDPDGYATLEVGGRDYGDAPAGYIANFSVPNLTLGPGAHASLRDDVNNGNHNGPSGYFEALYVGALELRPGARLDTGGLRLYYGNLIGSPAQIVDLLGIVRGDVNCDGSVDNGDIDRFVFALIDADAFRTTYPECPLQNADTNEDGFIDNADIDSFVALLLG